MKTIKTKLKNAGIMLCCIGFLLPSIISAQEARKFRVGIDVGYLNPHKANGHGFAGFQFVKAIDLKAIELKYNLQNNKNIGLKAEDASICKHDSYQSDLRSFSITYDYYFHNTDKRYSSFIGAGLGYYFCEAYDYTVVHQKEIYSKYNNPICFIRVGFEFWKIRTSLTYNLIRKPSEINISNRNSDYISFTVGFYIGGGKWNTNNN